MKSNNFLTLPVKKELTQADQRPSKRKKYATTNQLFWILTGKSLHVQSE